MTTVETNGITIGYDDEGRGEPLMLIHGHPFDRSMWAPQVAELSGSWRVITPDLRGYGESTVVPGITLLETFARDLVALLDRLGIDRVVLGGLSMGGQIVLEFYRLFPDRSAPFCSPTPSPKARPSGAGRFATTWPTGCSPTACRVMRRRC